MLFSADEYFHIGCTHYTAGKPCQDHALSRSAETIACAIVADGCSTGGHTDAGARVLTFATLQAIRDHAKASRGSLDTAEESISARQRQLIGTVRPLLGLEKNDMLATCAYIYCTPHGALIRVQSDGVAAIQYRDGGIAMWRYEWVGNMPFYPSYEGAELEAFMKAHAADKDGMSFTSELVVAHPDGSYSDGVIESHALKEGIMGISMRISRDCMKEVACIAVFSDGVTQVENFEWRRAVVECLAFKNGFGEFAKRRMIRAIKRMHEVGKGPMDDISYAVVRIEPANAGEGEQK